MAVEFLAMVPSHVWDHRSLPVPIEDIADSHLSLLVRDVDDMSAAPGLDPGDVGSTVSGLLLPEHREIWVNAHEAKRWPRRRRYTIAHEIGHWVLHRERPGQIHCRASAVRPELALAEMQSELMMTSRLDRDPIEWEANMFGGGLLVPPPLLREHWDGDPGRLEEVSDLFEVSLSALTPRSTFHHGRAGLHFRHE